jgi:hypothetical protein
VTKAKEAWRNRIVGYSDEPVDQLLANPLNFRVHPKQQQDALKGVLAEVGIVQNVLCNRTTGHVIDGHLRISLALRDGQATVPVTWVELSEDEEHLVLATIDPVAAMTATDADKLDELLREVCTGDAAVQQMLTELAERSGVISPNDKDWSEAFNGVPDGERARIQQMTFTLSDEQVEVVKRALRRSQDMGAFVGTGNENSNGNALARICEDYLGER